MASSKPKKPQFEQYTAPDISTSLDKFTAQGAKFPGMQDTITQSALASLQAKESLFPGYTGTLGQAWQLAQSRGQGLVDPETAKRVSEMAAQSGFATGTGPGSEQMGLQAAKQYGLTSVGLQDSGMQIGAGLRAEGNAMMPYQPINLAFTPQAIRAEDLSIGQANTNIRNQQQAINYQYDQQYGGSPWAGLAGGLGGSILGAGAGFFGSGGNPAGALLGAGMGSQLGAGMGGAFGGAQSQQMGGMFGGLGQSLGTLGGLQMFGGGGFNPFGTFSSLGSAAQAAPYAGSYTQTQGGYVPRAQAVSNPLKQT
jgi:hypothetical protein